MMHRLPGALERETADLTAMADHIRTNPHQAYVAVRNALWPALHRLGFDGGDVLVQGGGAPTLLKMPGAPEIPEDFLAAHLARLDRLDPDAQHQPAPRGGEGDYDVVIASCPGPTSSCGTRPAGPPACTATCS